MSGASPASLAGPLLGQLSVWFSHSLARAISSYSLPAKFCIITGVHSNYCVTRRM